MSKFSTCLTEKCYKTISTLVMIFITMPGLAFAVLSIHCIMLRKYLELADFTIDINFFIYRIIISVALAWWVFEAIFRLLYGYEKFSAGFIIQTIVMIICDALTIMSTIGATAGWDDIFQLGILPPMVIFPLILLSVQVLAVVIIGVVLLAMFACDLISWFQYDHAEALVGRDSQPFIIFCRENSK